ncbi:MULTISPECIES: DUF6776 family protein [unclassified Dyella]|uniref:DUF6776 family protein n=1 Tax=unclassified Dyella TaxID=2634549 RepID=UPI000C84EFB0|nr:MULTISPECIES: DUF6776 family protein [unclassified Dyella]MDR3444133.1 hypothetical protein [Dyella sp.]PMQ06395.1 Cell division protein FtsL [Dyella sp. AD56]
MASRPPPRFVVRPHDAFVGRRRLWLGAAWVASLLIVGLVVGGIAHHGTPVAAEERQLKALTRQNNDLQQQVANLQRAGQVADIANSSLRKTLSEREEEISGLRADLGFYSRLTGGDAQREGLKVQEVRLQPVENSHAWNLTLSLTQNAKRGDDVTGNATVSIEGLRADKVVQLDWPSLGDTAQHEGIPFRFKYFQQLHSTIVLPADFRPTRLVIKVQPAGDDAVTRAVAWGEALSGHLTPTQGEQDAQP